MTSDKVMVQIEPERGGERFRGEVLKVIERGFRKIVGQYFPTNNGGGLIRDEGKGWGSDLLISAADALNAKKGELVAATILTYPDDKKGFTGRITEVIGNSENPMNDIRRVLLINNIPNEFSAACLREAAQFKTEVLQSDIAGRRDLRSLKFVTIDGATAKDFDDAVYCETNHQGFLLYVAIADVSHYVQVNSAIDKDAWERGTSVYYPNFVAPMLPEALSNELCSLKPNVPRLALVAEMQINFNGELISSQFYEAVIQSQARVTYGEAQELIENLEIEKLKHVRDEIRRCADLAKVLMARRFREGSLDLEIPETQLIIDAEGNPVDVIRSERLFAHRVIEEMMLMANIAVAKFLGDRNVPALYRIHESPSTEALAILEKYLRTFGGKVALNQGKLQKRLTKALEEFEGRPESHVLHILTLRSMAQAKYSPNNVGHFGLGFSHYAHFTSPIRRYPDLIIHRLIKNQIMPNSQYRLLSEEDLATAGTMLSACEQRAVKSERQLIAIKKARFMNQHVGKEFDGMVSSVVKFGLFVLLRGVEVDGLIRLETLGPDRYEYDEENLRLVAKRSGHTYSIGDAIKVMVESVDIDAGQVNFAMPGQALQRQGKPFANASANRQEKPNEKRKGRGRNFRGDRGDRSSRAGRTDRPERGDREQKPAFSYKAKSARRAQEPLKIEPQAAPAPAAKGNSLVAKLKERMRANKNKGLAEREEDKPNAKGSKSHRQAKKPRR